MTPEEQTQQICMAWRALYRLGDVAEMRSPKSARDGTVSGYFKSPDKLISACRHWGPKVSNVYLTMNPVNPDCYARSADVAKSRATVTTSDNEILHRRWLLTDVDAKRLPDISATDEEHQAALGVAQAIREYLAQLGGSVIVVDSGNGGHCWLPIDLPNDDSSRDLCKRVLAALGTTFDTDRAEVDQKTFNAARITKLPGTQARKGSNIPERPWRYAKIIEIPRDLEPVSRATLERIAGPLPAAEPRRQKISNTETGTQFDVEAWFAKHGVSPEGKEAYQGGSRWRLDCPFNPQHKAPDAAVFQTADGTLGYNCFHNSCSAYGWHEFRLHFEPAAYKRRNEPGAVYALTDVGNAERLVHLNSQEIRFCHTTGSWYVWNKRNFEADRTGELIRRMTKTVRSIYGEIADQSKEEVEKIVSHAKRSEALPKITAAVTLAQSLPGVPATPEEFDADPWLLNCANGTIDLKTGVLKEHTQSDLITYCLPFVFDPTAQANVWNQYLSRVQPKQENREYLQRAAGYTLTGSTAAHSLFFLYGDGRNGKTIFLEALRHVLEPLTHTLDKCHLMRDRMAGRGATPELAALRGSRFVPVTELQSDDRLDTARVKGLTGGDMIAARRNYGDPENFRPTFKLWLAGNHKPRIPDRDLGIWSRINLIHFGVTIPEEKRDPYLGDKLRDEAAGILGWCVRGCLEWHKQGLNPPKEVIEATRQYKSAEDPLADFLSEHCVMGTGCKIEKARLWQAYQGYAQQSGDRSFSSQRALGLAISRNEAITPDKAAGGKHIWLGIGLSTDTQIMNLGAAE